MASGINHELPAPLESEYLEMAWGIERDGEKHKPLWIARPKVTDNTVKFEMLYAGICHSEVHTGLNDWGPCNFPFVGGHELLGRVTEVGSLVTKFKVGDICAVGCMVDSCNSCSSCARGHENYCATGFVGTYNAPKKYKRVGGNSTTFTAGGYSCANTVHEDFVIKIPDGMDLQKTAPILCAGITMYTPLKQFGATGSEKMTVGIVGIGGLGTMGIKLAKALGNDVMAISTNANKKESSLAKGADYFVCSKDPEDMRANGGKCNLILNTVKAPHDLNLYLPLLIKGGSTLVQLGGVTSPHSVSQFSLMFCGLAIAGSLIGGIRDTQEVVDLCFKHNIYPDCEMVEAKDIDACWASLKDWNSDGVRYVIDIKKSMDNKDFIPK